MVPLENDSTTQGRDLLISYGATNNHIDVYYSRLLREISLIALVLSIAAKNVGFEIDCVD